MYPKSLLVEDFRTLPPDFELSQHQNFSRLKIESSWIIRNQVYPQRIRKKYFNIFQKEIKRKIPHSASTIGTKRRSQWTQRWKFKSIQFFLGFGLLLISLSLSLSVICLVCVCRIYLFLGKKNTSAPLHLFDLVLFSWRKVIVFLTMVKSKPGNEGWF